MLVFFVVFFHQNYNLLLAFYRVFTGLMFYSVLPRNGFEDFKLNFLSIRNNPWLDCWSIVGSYKLF